ncbi:MAG: hypothetical protein M5U28_33505 [Sandaracinaceae bacterium]|nr:hypothetical protein [Sandaracinaceae bacterium]
MRRQLSSGRGFAAAAATALAGALLAACDGGATVFIEARTDAVPGVEFAVARVEIVAGTDFSAPRTTHEVPAMLDQDWATGRRVAEVGGLTAGTYTVRVQLLAASGTVRLERYVRATIDRDSVLTVVLTRSCGWLVCPAPDGDPDATTCFGGLA